MRGLARIHATRTGALALVLALALGLGCGYTLVRRGGALADVRSVAIATPSNETGEPGVEYVVAEALRREFLRRGTVRLVEDPSRADLALQGEVKGIFTRAASVDSVVLAIEYELTLEIALEAHRRGGAGVPLDRHALRESERYVASPDVEAERKNRQEALRQLANVLAGRAYLLLQETLEQGREAAAQRAVGERSAGPRPDRGSSS